MRYKGSFILLFAAAVFGQQAEQPTPPTRTVQASCDAAWPAMLSSAIKEGWSVKNSDKAGGILTLEWTRGEQTGSSNKINPLVKQYTVEKSTGFWSQYTGFRVASGIITLTPKSEACSITVSVVYHGREIRIRQGERWWILRSNGYLENKMLDSAATALK